VFPLALHLQELNSLNEQANKQQNTLPNGPDGEASKQTIVRRRIPEEKGKITGKQKTKNRTAEEKNCEEESNK